MTPAELKHLIKAGQIDTVLTVFPDMAGRLMGKRVTGRFFVDQILTGGMHACAYLLTVDMEMEPLPGFSTASWASGYQDFKALPDFSTLRRIPWLEKTALVICDLVTEKGDPVEVSPRQILKRQIARAQKAGYRPKMGSELEFYLYKETYDSARTKHFQDLEPYGAYLEDYHILQTSKEEFVIQAIRNGMEAAGIPVEVSKGEWGKGQEEINLRYADALEMADRHVIYKNGVKEIAYQKGVAVTFMAKPHVDRAGSSFHLHSSLWDRTGKKNLFAKGIQDKLFRHYVAGQLSLGRAMSYCFAPTVNSYKRYQSGSFAPTRLAWGEDNRTCGLRVVGEGSSLRIENRLPGADANPYLAFAATIAAGLHGIQNKMEPPSLFHGDAYSATVASADPPRRSGGQTGKLPQVPKTLHEALDEFEHSKALRQAFGDQVVEHYAHAGRLEQAAYDQSVTDWELKRYFERI
jgi:glutamine synthetase